MHSGENFQKVTQGRCQILLNLIKKWMPNSSRCLVRAGLGTQTTLTGDISFVYDNKPLERACLKRYPYRAALAFQSFAIISFKIIKQLSKL